jgi:hypothetical protein
VFSQVAFDTLAGPCQEEHDFCKQYLHHKTEGSWSEKCTSINIKEITKKWKAIVKYLVEQKYKLTDYKT